MNNMGHHEIMQAESGGVVWGARKSEPQWAAEHIWGEGGGCCGGNARLHPMGPGNRGEELLLLPGSSGEPVRTLEQDSYSHILTKDGA